MDEFRSSVDELTKEQRIKARGLWRALGRQILELAQPSAESSESDTPILGGSEEEGLEIIPSTEVPPPEEGAGEGLLGPFLPGGGEVVLLAGETSAGKTVLVYNIAYHLAEGTEFAGLMPPEPLRVLYLDLESPENVHRDFVEVIGRSQNLAFIRRLLHTLDTPMGRDELKNAIQKWEAIVVIIDPLPIAWPSRDENDNAEADRQMWAIKRLAIDTSTLIVALWNMGEGQVKEKFKARGATARMDRIDLGLNYLELSETTRQLKIVKSRHGSLGLHLTLKFAGDYGFEAVELGSGITPTRIARMQANIREFMTERTRTGNDAVWRKEMVEALGEEDLLDKAIHKMLLARDVERVERGQYRLLVSSEPPSIEASEVRKPEISDSRSGAGSCTHRPLGEVDDRWARNDGGDDPATCGCCGGPTRLEVPPECWDGLCPVCRDGTP